MTVAPTAAAGDPAAVFTAAQARIVQLVGALGDADLARPVPATPGWSVRDLVSHLAGVSADALTGDVHPQSPEWTATHVRERSDLSVEQVLDEWLRTGPRVEELLRGSRSMRTAALIADTVLHEQDLRGAVGEPGARDGAGLELTARLLAKGVGAKLRERGLPALRLEGGGWSAVAGEGEPAATVRFPSLFELVRAVSGRRSRAQVRGCDWSGDPEPYLPAFSVFGDLRETDLVE